LALIIRCALEDVNLLEAIERAVARLEKEPGHEECVTALERAVALWDREGREGDVEKLGAGWVAEEALAIGVFGALAGEESFATGIQLAANHSGDSDSTAAIAGNILGALYGEDEALANGYRGVELREEIVRLADDLFAAWQDEPGWEKRYPAGP
jgi:ADP-ribosylglycohydrolase